MAGATRFTDLQKSHQKMYQQLLQTESMQRAASEMKIQEQFAVSGEDSTLGNFGHSSNSGSVKVTSPFNYVHRPLPSEELDLKIGPPYNPLPRIDFPLFDGYNPRAWMLKCNSFFKLMPNIHDAQRIHLASMHFDGRALAWFQDLNMVEVGITWKQFLEVIYARFEMMPISHIILEFNELKQNGSYDDYVEKFEELSAYFIAHFMSGLSEELQSFLHIFRPRTLVDTIELGRKHLTTLDAIARKMKVPSRVPLPTPVPAELPPTKLLTSFEMAARIDKGLCSNCDEPFASSHRCKKRINYVLVTEEEELLEAQVTTELGKNDADGDIVQSTNEVQISLHSMMGNGGLTTMRVAGEVGDHKLNTLLVTGFDADKAFSPLKEMESYDLILGGYFDETFAAKIDVAHAKSTIMLVFFLKGTTIVHLNMALRVRIPNFSFYENSERKFKKGIGTKLIHVLKSLEYDVPGASLLGIHFVTGRVNKVLQNFANKDHLWLVFVAEADAALLCCKKQTFVQQLSKAAVDRNFKIEPLLSISTYVLTQAGKKITQMLLHRLKVRSDSAIWEVEKFLHRKIPSFDPRGRGSFRGGGIVMYQRWAEGSYWAVQGVDGLSALC